MSLRAGSGLTQDQERGGDIVVEEYRGLAFLLVQVSEGDWRAEKIVVDAREGVEWLLPALPFPSAERARDYSRRIIDAAFPPDRFGDQAESVE